MHFVESSRSPMAEESRNATGPNRLLTSMKETSAVRCTLPIKIVRCQRVVTRVGYYLATLTAMTTFACSATELPEVSTPTVRIAADCRAARNTHLTSVMFEYLPANLRKLDIAAVPSPGPRVDDRQRRCDCGRGATHMVASFTRHSSMMVFGSFRNSHSQLPRGRAV
jgi:hypothetical protein